MSIRQVDSLLNEVQSRPAHYSFGAYLAEASYDSIRRGDRRLSDGAAAIASALQRRVSVLLTSDHPQDQQAVRTTADIFRERDHSLFVTEMSGMRASDPGANILEWIATATPRDVAVLALWNRDRRDTLQRRLDEDYQDLVDTALNDVDTHIDNGIYPRQAIALYEDAFRRYGHFKALDSFESGLMGADGYCNDELIAIANLYNDSGAMAEQGQRLFDVVIHEGTHALGINRGINNRGFLSGLASDHAYLLPPEERWASQTEGAFDKRFATPEEKTRLKSIHDATRSYALENSLFDLAEQHVPGGIPKDLYGHAFLSVRNSPEGQRVRRELEAKLLHAFGGTAFYSFCESYTAADSYEEREQIVTTEIVRLRDLHAVCEPVDEEPVAIATYKEVESAASLYNKAEND